MQILKMLVREILYHKSSFFLSFIAVVVAVASFLGAISVLDVHDVATTKLIIQKQKETQERLSEFNKDISKAALKLGFNLLILPKDQNLRDWHTEDFASKYMPEEYVTKLADSGIVIVRHFLPSLQQKIEWPEVKRTIILIGTRGEVPNMFKNPKKPLVQPVPTGTIVLGYELHKSLGLKVGDTVQLMGRKFTVHKCYNERGSKDDITAWISLHEAQDLLNKKDKINAILALKCLCAGSEDIAKVRSKIGQILPNTQSVEVGSKVVARAEARLKVQKETEAMIQDAKTRMTQIKMAREHFASIIVPLIMMVCIVLIAYLGFVNVKDREMEIGLLRVLGYRSGQLMFLFLAKALLAGLLGSVVGFVLGVYGGQYLGFVLEGDTVGIFDGGKLLNISTFALTLLISCLLAIVAGWIPALLAARRDPADILRGE